MLNCTLLAAKDWRITAASTTTTSFLKYVRLEKVAYMIALPLIRDLGIASICETRMLNKLHNRFAWICEPGLFNKLRMNGIARICETWMLNELHNQFAWICEIEVL